MNKRTYDCIVIGGGWGGIAFALLYAMQGKKIALFESHDKLGGYGHCFEKNGYQFCANMHYFFDTQAGGSVNEFLKRVQLETKIIFAPLDKENFDIIRVNDFSFGIPSDLETYRDKLINYFPESKDSIDQLFKVRDSMVTMTNLFSKSKILFFSSLLSHPTHFINFTKFFLKSSSNVLNNLNIQGKLRSIILSRVGNFGMLSNDIPLLFLLLEMTYYTNCATFPVLGMNHFVEEIHKKLIEYNVSIYLNTEITKINRKKNKILSVLDKNGNEYFSQLFISDIDPQLTLKLADYPINNKYNYQYTYSCFSLYLGLKNINLSEYKLGNFNIWYFPTEDIDLSCESPLYHLNYKNSFLFISTPSAHVRHVSLSPINSHTMQIVAPANYHLIFDLYKKSQIDYENFKLQVKNDILNVIKEKFIPQIRNYIEIEEFWSPIDLAHRVKAPFGTMYGMSPNKRKIIHPIGQKSPFSNLYFVGATASNPGLSFVLASAMQLVDRII